LVVSSLGCNFQLIAALVPCVPAAITPGYRNEFHAGLQQAFGKYLVIDGEYIWLYSHNAFDFSDLGNTPIFTPIEWHNSKIPGFAVRASVPSFHGLTAQVVLSKGFVQMYECGRRNEPVSVSMRRLIRRKARSLIFDETEQRARSTTCGLELEVLAP
jgi:hypothetical protein